MENNRKPKTIRPGRWILVFFLIIAAGLAVYMYICFRANPLGYFTNELGLDYYSSNDYTRSIKARYILAHDDIKGVVIGGSKGGVIDPELIEEYSGKKYYNFYVNSGNFSDYLAFTRFFATKTNVDEITLHLSSFETKSFSRSHLGNNYELPAVMTEGKFGQFLEFVSYLLTDTETISEAFKDRPHMGTGKQDLLATGMRNRATRTLEAMEDPDAFAEKYVTMHPDQSLQRLFSGYAAYTVRNYAASLDALREMKKICDENGVTLKCIIGISFVYDHYQYEWPGYYDFLAEIVNIVGEVWDFSDYNDINMNPYNFYDSRHYDLAVSNLMIRTIFGKDSYEGFGTLLTPDNVYRYLEKRRSDLAALKQEYEKTGKITLQTMEDESFLPWEVKEHWDMSVNTMAYEDDQAGGEDDG